MDTTPYQGVTDQQLRTAGLIYAVYPASPSAPDNSGQRVVLFDTPAPVGVSAAKVQTVRVLGIALDREREEGQLLRLRKRIGLIKRSSA